MTLIISIIWLNPSNRENLYYAFLRYILEGIIYPLMDLLVCLSLSSLFLAQGKYLEKISLMALATDDRDPYRLTTNEDVTLLHPKVRDSIIETGSSINDIRESDASLDSEEFQNAVHRDTKAKKTKN